MEDKTVTTPEVRGVKVKFAFFSKPTTKTIQLGSTLKEVPSFSIDEFACGVVRPRNDDAVLTIAYTVDFEQKLAKYGWSVNNPPHWRINPDGFDSISPALNRGGSRGFYIERVAGDLFDKKLAKKIAESRLQNAPRKIDVGDSTIVSAILKDIHMARDMPKMACTVAQLHIDVNEMADYYQYDF